MVQVVWIILRRNDRYLLAQRSLSDRFGGTWVFPGGKIDPTDTTAIDASYRELKEEVDLEGQRFRLLCPLPFDKYCVNVFVCDKWRGKPKPACSDIIGIGWFTLVEIYTLGESLAPFMNNSLVYLSYLMQHYDHHPDEWENPWMEYSKTTKE